MFPHFKTLAEKALYSSIQSGKQVWIQSPGHHLFEEKKINMTKISTEIPLFDYIQMGVAFQLLVNVLRQPQQGPVP